MDHDLAVILSRLDGESVMVAADVCAAWRRVLTSKLFWTLRGAMTKGTGIESIWMSVCMERFASVGCDFDPTHPDDNLYYVVHTTREENMHPTFFFAFEREGTWSMHFFLIGANMPKMVTSKREVWLTMSVMLTESGSTPSRCRKCCV
jgi:hypothetical protein